MTQKFREQATCTILGIVGIGVPAEVINHVTGDTAPFIVLAMVLFASIMGFGMGAWSTDKKYQEESEEDEPE